MNSWTIFYWGWWIAWCPFVGMFIAKISYGRTVKVTDTYICLTINFEEKNLDLATTAMFFYV
jgi:choline-glycine betaine transporter